MEKEHEDKYENKLQQNRIKICIRNNAECFSV